MKRIVWLLLTVLMLLLSGVTHADLNYGSFAIDQYLTVNATTHRLSTGALYDASAITYRIYEANSPTELVGATAMTKFDGIDGVYAAQVQLLAATGFEQGKSYRVLKEATVDGVSGGTWDTFQIGLNVGQLAGHALPTDVNNVFNNVIEAAGAGDSINLDASGNVTLADASLTAAKFDGSTAVPQTGDLWAALVTMLELDGAVYRWTDNSLEQGPSGAGTFTADDRILLRGAALKR